MMYRSVLQSRTILATRPGGISEQLRESIKRQGGQVLHLPSIEIRPLIKSESAEQLLRTLIEFDVLIFVSKNAVKYAGYLMADIVGQAREKTILAIGSGTYKELLGLGFDEVGYTDGNTGSEALLGIDELQQENVRNKRIMIVRGQGGRELLGDKLIARGAHIQYVELYLRAKPQIEAVQIKNLWRVDKPDAVLVTSAEGLKNLLEMTAEEERFLFLNTRLVVISPRLKDIAEAMGFSAEIKVAKGYSDDDFMVALMQMFEAHNDER